MSTAMPFSLISFPSLISRNRAGPKSSCFLGQQESPILWAIDFFHFHVRGRKVGEPAAISGRPWKKGLTLSFSLFCEKRWRGRLRWSSSIVIEERLIFFSFFFPSFLNGLTSKNKRRKLDYSDGDYKVRG